MKLSPLHLAWVTWHPTMQQCAPLENHFSSVTEAQPSMVESIVLICVFLQIVLMVRYPHEQVDMEGITTRSSWVPGNRGRAWTTYNKWGAAMWTLGQPPSNASPEVYLRHFFSSPAGSVAWQDHMVSLYGLTRTKCNISWGSRGHLGFL